MIFKILKIKLTILSKTSFHKKSASNHWELVLQWINTQNPMYYVNPSKYPTNLLCFIFQSVIISEKRTVMDFLQVSVANTVIWLKSYIFTQPLSPVFSLVGSACLDVFVDILYNRRQNMYQCIWLNMIRVVDICCKNILIRVPWGIHRLVCILRIDQSLRWWLGRFFIFLFSLSADEGDGVQGGVGFLLGSSKVVF